MGGEMGENIDSLNKNKAKAEKDKAAMERDLMDTRGGLDEAMRERANMERNCKMTQGLIVEANTQLELGLVKQEIDRKIAEKEEEFENTRKNHGRAMESLQASLDTEQRAKGEGLRIKKKLEGEINEFEIALDHANKANNEALKSIKRYQGQLREAETQYEEASRARQDMAEKASP